MLLKLSDCVVNTEFLAFAKYDLDLVLDLAHLMLAVQTGNKWTQLEMSGLQATECWALLCQLAEKDLAAGRARALAATYEPEKVRAEINYLNAYAAKLRMEIEEHDEVKRNMEELHRKGQQIEEELKKDE